MARILKVLGIVAGALVLLVIGVLLAVSLLVDPNDYKDEITTAVNEATGRTLTLEGDLELNLFPRLGIGLGGAELSNAEGFGNEPFARIDGAELSVGLLPLLFRRVEVDRASLEGLRLNLARNAAGETNWDDLAASGTADGDSAGPSDDGGGSAVDISVGAINVSDAEVLWSDAMTGNDWRLADFNLEARGVDATRAFPLAVAFELAGTEITVAVSAEMNALIGLAENTYRLDDLSISIDGEGPGWPGGSGEASLGFDSFIANLDSQTLALDGLELEMLGVTINGNLAGSDLLDDLSLEGGIEIDEFDPRDVMAVFDTTIETADSDVMRRASASADFYYTAAAMGMRGMTLQLDDSTLTGSAGLNGERVEFDLNVDAINIDNYLPPPADGADVSDPDQGSVDEVDLPLDPLRNFAARGNLALDETQFLGMTFTDANFALTASNGRMTLAPTGALYGGTLDGNITIAVQADDSARLSLVAELAGVDMTGVGRDYLKIDTLAGTGSVSLNLASVGTQVGEIKRGLDGTASVAITDGALLGIDIWQRMMEARAALTGPDVPAADGEPRTSFERIAVSGPVADAVLTTQEFSAMLSFASLTGTGTIDLLTTALDLRARAGLVDGPTLQQDPTLARFAGRQIPLTISGTLAAPRVLPDIGGLLSQAVQDEVDEEVDAARDEARERVQEELEEERESILRRLLE